MRRISSHFAVLLFVFGLLLGGICGGIAVAAQTHMINALSYLNSARSELYRATPDKGGYRTSAMHHIDEAITDVNNGIRYARY